MERLDNTIYYWDDLQGVNANRLGRYLTQKELEFIEPFLANHSIKNALEIGCGSGRLSVPMSRLGLNITGLDSDPLALKLLSERAREIKTIQADCRKPLPLKDEAYDAVFAIEFLDYLDNLDTFFKEAHRVLKPSGWFVFTSGNAQSYKSFLQKKFGRHKGRYLFTTKQILISLEKAGFQLKEIKGYNWLPVRRESNSRLVPILAHVEKTLGLETLVKYSPSIICLARKK